MSEDFELAEHSASSSKTKDANTFLCFPRQGKQTGLSPPSSKGAGAFLYGVF